jgi:hypothetical protein
MAIMSGNPMLKLWEPETVRTFLVRVAGKLLTGNRQLTVKTPDNHLYPQVWEDWVAVGFWVNDPINKHHNQRLSLAFVREGGLSLANHHPIPIIFWNCWCVSVKKS